MELHRLERLVNYCWPSQKKLKAMLESELLQQRGQERIRSRDGFLYSPGSHPVLLIAHLDTVHKQRPTMFFIDKSRTPDGDLWCAEGIGGDDRYGVFIIMELLRELDCHVLFTEDEEIGGRGAVKFCESGLHPDVQFMVEFDRQGKDNAVFYGCDNPDFTAFVEQYGFKQNEGTFSDISIIAPALGIAAVNLSSGYYCAHSRQEYIRVADVKSIIDRASRLISNVKTRYGYVNGDHPDWRWDSDGWRYDGRNDEAVCPACNVLLGDSMFLDYCPCCFSPLIVPCDWCGDAVRISDCTVIKGEVYCRFCAE